MKKLFTIFIVVALATTTSLAQFGLKAGMNMANFSLNDNAKEFFGDDNSMKVGLAFGANYRAELSDAMSLDISATYKQSGTKSTDESSNTDIFGVKTKYESSGTISVGYLDISPSLSFNLSDVFALSVGPYIAFAVGGKGKSESTTTISGGGSLDGSVTSSSEETLKFGTGDNDDFKGTDFGINIGTTYFINDAMSVSAGYSLGLTNLLHWPDELKDAFDAANEDVPSIKNSGIYIGVGYSFGGGRYY